MTIEKTNHVGFRPQAEAYTFAQRMFMPQIAFDENDGVGGGGTPNPPQNQPGGAGKESEQTENNTSQDAIDKSFWENEEEESTPPKDQQQKTGNPVEEFNRHLEGIQFGNVFDESITEQIQNGDFTELNKRIATQGREAVKQTLMMIAPMLNQLQTSLLETIDDRVSNGVNRSDNDRLLRESIPTAADPVMGPMIKGVFEQALTKTKGDGREAVKLTKQMLRQMAGGNAEVAEYSFEPNVRRQEQQSHNERASKIDFGKELGLTR